MNVQELIDNTIQESFERLFFYHQNIPLIPENIGDIIELVKSTNEFLSLVNKNNLKANPIKLKALNQIVEDLMLNIEPEPQLFNICHDPIINAEIIH